MPSYGHEGRKFDYINIQVNVIYIYNTNSIQLSIAGITESLFKNLAIYNRIRAMRKREASLLRRFAVSDF